MAGILVAAIGLALSQLSGNPFFDGAASVVIGLILGVTALVLAIESKALLIGESADPGLVQGIFDAAKRQPGVVGVGHVLTVHSAPDQITVVMSADFEDTITAGAVERIIAYIATEFEAMWPEVKRLYIRPQQGAGKSE
jgi:divalent metal cation (Fe/Co/Zn/Cd) transporter